MSAKDLALCPVLSILKGSGSVLRIKSVANLLITIWLLDVRGRSGSDAFHVTSRQSHNPLLIWYRDREDDGKDKYVSIIDDDTFPEHKFSLTIPFVLWNPMTKKLVAIDSPTNELYKSPKYDTAIGFGVCLNTLDTKLVKITFTCEVPFISTPIIIQVEVYTLSSRVWRILVSINLPRKSLLFLSSVDLDGFIYWLSWDTVSHSYLIMSFDLTSEAFTEVYLPDHNLLSLSKLGESLVVLENNNGEKCVWIMKNGDPKSFTRIYTIDMPNEKILSVLGFRKSGEPIIEIKKDKNESEIIIYKPNTNQISYTGIVGEFCFIGI
ncbi:putative F-box domain-containing protein [Tanacetum coccineum]